MRIFTEKGFQEELNRRREAYEEFQYNRRRFAELEEKFERLYMVVEDLKRALAEREEECQE